MDAGLRVPMAENLIWANVLRPRIPLVYLDLHVIIRMARASRGGTDVPAEYLHLRQEALRAKWEGRARFPLSSEHLWEVAQITDPQQRADIAAILAELSDYAYLAGRTVIAELEMEAGMAMILGEDISDRSIPLVRPTFGHAFGMVGGVKVLNPDGSDGSDAVRATMPDGEFAELMANLNYEMERHILRGPSDQDLEELLADPQFRPEVALASQRSRVAWELDTERVLNEAPKWRRGRPRDLICAREWFHEWNEMYARLRIARQEAGLPPFDPSDAEMRMFMGALPHIQVAASLKTRYHRNPRHLWTVNDIVDIDAVSVAYAYCEAVFPDKAIRNALLSSKELRTIGTFVPRRPGELADWLSALPSVIAPEFLVPHPLKRSMAPGG